MQTLKYKRPAAAAPRALWRVYRAQSRAGGRRGNRNCYQDVIAVLPPFYGRLTPGSLRVVLGPVPVREAITERF